MPVQGVDSLFEYEAFERHFTAPHTLKMALPKIQIRFLISFSPKVEYRPYW